MTDYEEINNLFANSYTDEDMLNIYDIGKDQKTIEETIFPNSLAASGLGVNSPTNEVYLAESKIAPPSPEKPKPKINVLTPEECQQYYQNQTKQNKVDKFHKEFKAQHYRKNQPEGTYWNETTEKFDKIPDIAVIDNEIEKMNNDDRLNKENFKAKPINKELAQKIMMNPEKSKELITSSIKRVDIIEGLKGYNQDLVSEIIREREEKQIDYRGRDKSQIRDKSEINTRSRDKSQIRGKDNYTDRSRDKSQIRGNDSHMDRSRDKSQIRGNDSHIDRSRDKSQIRDKSPFKRRESPNDNNRDKSPIRDNKNNYDRSRDKSQVRTGNNNFNYSNNDYKSNKDYKVNDSHRSRDKSQMREDFTRSRDKSEFRGRGKDHDISRDNSQLRESNFKQNYRDKSPFKDTRSRDKSQIRESHGNYNYNNNYFNKNKEESKGNPYYKNKNYNPHFCQKNNYFSKKPQQYSNFSNAGLDYTEEDTPANQPYQKTGKTTYTSSPINLISPARSISRKIDITSESETSCTNDFEFKKRKIKEGLNELVNGFNLDRSIPQVTEDSDELSKNLKSHLHSLIVDSTEKGFNLVLDFVKSKLTLSEGNILKEFMVFRDEMKRSHSDVLIVSLFYYMWLYENKFKTNSSKRHDAGLEKSSTQFIQDPNKSLLNDAFCKRISPQIFHQDRQNNSNLSRDNSKSPLKKVPVDDEIEKSEKENKLVSNKLDKSPYSDLPDVKKSRGRSKTPVRGLDTSTTKAANLNKLKTVEAKSPIAEATKNKKRVRTQSPSSEEEVETKKKNKKRVKTQSASSEEEVETKKKNKKIKDKSLDDSKSPIKSDKNKDLLKQKRKKEEDIPFTPDKKDNKKRRVNEEEKEQLDTSARNTKQLSKEEQKKREKVEAEMNNDSTYNMVMKLAHKLTDKSSFANLKKIIPHESAMIIEQAFKTPVKETIVVDLYDTDKYKIFLNLTGHDYKVGKKIKDC